MTDGHSGLKKRESELQLVHLSQWGAANGPQENKNTRARTHHILNVYKEPGQCHQCNKGVGDLERWRIMEEMSRKRKSWRAYSPTPSLRPVRHKDHCPGPPPGSSEAHISGLQHRYQLIRLRCEWSCVPSPNTISMPLDWGHMDFSLSPRDPNIIIILRLQAFFYLKKKRKGKAG